MAPKHKLVLGRERHEWVAGALKALIANTDPQSRFLMLRGGVVTFVERARWKFRAEAGLDFRSDELHWIFKELGKWVRRHESHLQTGFEAMFARTRRVNSTDRFNVDDTPDDYFVETATRGRVH